MPKPAKAGLVRTIGGPRPLNNKITIYGWSTGTLIQRNC
jgi:hypothetical protein